MQLTPKTVAFTGSEEGVVLEWYKDGGGVGTWAMGVTNASGHNVDRYKDNPQSLARCLEVSVWLLRTKYLPDVERAFASAATPLTEAQIAAALSFHWNTGAIGKTDWVKLWLAGMADKAKTFLLSHYLNGGALAARRKREAALFFDGVWPADLRVPIYPVRKPGYTPNFAKGVRTDIMPALQQILGGA